LIEVLRNRKALIAKPGMDAHWRGAIVVAHALRDAGMEVVYLGHATAEELASVAAQEDPAVIGLSSLSGNHRTEGPAVAAALKMADVSDVVLVIGGAIPSADTDMLLSAGFDGVFPTGTRLSKLVEGVASLVEKKLTNPARLD
jgi:methylmalonyl-CoA mutase C-terminal domain/subunit